MHIHTEECRWTVKGDGKRRCLTARLERERAARAAGTRDRMGKRIPRPVDGWEDLYGPCPMPVPVDQWYDHVAVDRAVAGLPVGRDLGASERQEVNRRLEEQELTKAAVLTLPPSTGRTTPSKQPGRMKMGVRHV